MLQPFRTGWIRIGGVVGARTHPRGARGGDKMPFRCTMFVWDVGDLVSIYCWMYLTGVEPLLASVYGVSYCSDCFFVSFLSRARVYLVVRLLLLLLC